MCNQSKCECWTEAAKPHIHAASMKLYAEDAAETDKPWERWEARHLFSKPGLGWCKCVDNPGWSNSFEYRRKRKMRVVNGFSVPAPETEIPKANTQLYLANATTPGFCCDFRWVKESYYLSFLSRGLVFLNKDDAVANAKAMCGIDPSS